MALLDDAYKQHMKLLREIAEKNQEIAILRDESGIAKEVIQRFVHPDLLHSAEKWLKDKGL